MNNLKVDLKSSAGKLLSKAQETSKSLTENIEKAGKTGKDILQEKVQDKLSARLEKDEHDDGESLRQKVTGNITKVSKAGKDKLQGHLPNKTKDTENTEAKRESLDARLQVAVNEYNGAYTIMNDHGSSLYTQRERAIDVICNVENLINSIANHPKEFDKDIAEIVVCRQEFKRVCDYARQELELAQKSAMSAGAGVAGGAAVVSLAPSAAMWVATTFGTASTGTAISTLSGAAATNAALAWLGGGALSAGGGGMSAGSALLALAGPIGWGVAGATLLASIALFANKKIKLDKEKKQEIESVMGNTEQIREVDVKIKDLLDKTVSVRDALGNQYGRCLTWYEKDYLSIPEDGQHQLGTLVNEAKSLAVLLGKGI